MSLTNCLGGRHLCFTELASVVCRDRFIFIFWGGRLPNKECIRFTVSTGHSNTSGDCQPSLLSWPRCRQRFKPVALCRPSCSAWFPLQWNRRLWTLSAAAAAAATAVRMSLTVRVPTWWALFMTSWHMSRWRQKLWCWQPGNPVSILHFSHRHGSCLLTSWI